jgi:hypothetical protein
MATAGDSEMRSSATLSGLAGLLDELRWRGMLHQYSSGLDERLATGQTIKGYNGFDPTGPSLHIGHLVPIFGLIHLQRRGGMPVIVVGGGTAMIATRPDARPSVCFLAARRSRRTSSAFRASSPGSSISKGPTAPSW